MYIHTHTHLSGVRLPKACRECHGGPAPRAPEPVQAVGA